MATCMILFMLVLIASTSDAQLLYGRYNYSTYEVGGSETKFVISAPHAGYLKPSTIPDRHDGCFDKTVNQCVYKTNCSNQSSVQCRTVRGIDGNTDLLAQEIVAALTVKYGGSDKVRPHLIMNKLHRSKMDANRNLNESTFGNPVAVEAWYDYHGFIDRAIVNVTTSGRRTFYIDVHGQATPEKWTMLGYLLPNEVLKGKLDIVAAQKSSIRKLHTTSGESIENLIRGHSSIGAMLESKGYRVIPSPKNKDAGTAKTFFSGGYSTVRHTAKVDGMQLEAYSNIRNDAATRKRFASDFADALKTFLDKYAPDNKVIIG